jgi:hypothetical protein
VIVNKIRPASFKAMAGRKGSALLRARKHPLNSQNRNALQTATPWSWLQIGQIVTEVVLPKVAAARERDRVVRLRLGLDLVDWGARR